MCENINRQVVSEVKKKEAILNLANLIKKYSEELKNINLQVKGG